MARYECERCNAVCFTTDPPHLCKDIQKRLIRQEKQRDAVVAILEDHYGYELDGILIINLAEKIIERLNKLNLHQD